MSQAEPSLNARVAKIIGWVRGGTCKQVPQGFPTTALRAGGRMSPCVGMDQCPLDKCDQVPTACRYFDDEPIPKFDADPAACELVLDWLVANKCSYKIVGSEAGCGCQVEVPGIEGTGLGLDFNRCRALCLAVVDATGAK